MNGEYIIYDENGTALTLLVTNGMVRVYDENDQSFDLPVTELYP